MRVLLTQKLIESATSKDKKGVVHKQLDHFDTLTPGFCLRVTKAGKKTWTFVFTIPASSPPERTRLTLGEFPGLGLADARIAAAAARILVEVGKDPRVKPVVVKEKTIAELCQDRIDRVLRPKGLPPLRTADEIERRYRKEIIPFIGDVSVKGFDVVDYNTVIDEIADRECFVLANRVHSDLKALLKFGCQRGEIKYSPIADQEPPFDEKPRTRWLSLEEIVHFWNQTPQALIRSVKVQRILPIILATGKRSNEVCGAKRTEFNWLARTWTIPKERVKGEEKDAQDELVPLSDLAIYLFQEAIRHSNSEYIFPNDEGDGPYEPRVVAKAVKLALDPADDLPMGRYGMVKWTPHDLRRTVGTQLLRSENGLKVTKEQKYLVLNHIAELKQNVSDRVYDHNDYLPEKREAMNKWGNFLANLLGIELQQQEAA